MQTDPPEEWRRLAEEYRQMSDDELRNLADDFANLTEIAQQALSREMRSRNLGDPRVPDHALKIAAQPIPQQVIDESKEEIPEFLEPTCPKCGSEDVVLEGVDSQNHWRCEACNAEWSDDAELGTPNPQT
jgi:formate dehydrogenase maturation protein FdhE